MVKATRLETHQPCLTCERPYVSRKFQVWLMHIAAFKEKGEGDLTWP